MQPQQLVQSVAVKTSKAETSDHSDHCVLLYILVNITEIQFSTTLQCKSASCLPRSDCCC